MTNRNKQTRVLHVKVGETLGEAGARAAETMKSIDAGRQVKPYFGASF